MKKTSETSCTTLIRQAGFRATKPRLAVLAYLQKVKYPVDIKQIVARVGHHADQVTVYRVLEAFKMAGLVSLVDFQQGRAFYEFKDAHHDHHHIVCTSCNRVEDFVGCGSDALSRTALRQAKDFAQVTSHSLELFGLCKSCI